VNVRPDQPNERRPAAAFDEVFPSGSDSRNVALRRFTIVVVTIFWISQFGANTLFTQLTSPSSAWETMWPRALSCVVGEVITLVGIALQDRWRDAPLRIRAYWAVAFTIASSAVLGALGYLIFEAFLGPMGDSPLWTRFWYNYAVQVVPRLWVFGTVYAMALAISYSSDVRQREEEIVGLRALAQETQLRALRSQLNPHFLFNALNSIAALIRDGKSEQAEAVTEDVADFLRITVTLDPQRLITLGEEAALQRLYLDIQKVRFPTRLNIIFDIGPTVEDALVPNLILQPLVENSIKHAVAQSTEPVTVRVSASADGSKLRVLVEDDGGNAASGGAASGSSIGLVNVAQRLTAHFGSSATLTSVPTDEGGYRNLIVMPLRRSS